MPNVLLMDRWSEMGKTHDSTDVISKALSSMINWLSLFFFFLRVNDGNNLLVFHAKDEVRAFGKSCQNGDAWEGKHLDDPFFKDFNTPLWRSTQYFFNDIIDVWGRVET